MNNWQALREAEIRAQAEEERLCALYECYPWEIEIERNKPKNRKKEVLPFIYKHMDNGVELNEESLRELFIRHGVVDEEAEGTLHVELEDLSADLLEDLLKLFIEANDRLKKSKAQHNRHCSSDTAQGLPPQLPESKREPLETWCGSESTSASTSPL